MYNGDKDRWVILPAHLEYWAVNQTINQGLQMSLPGERSAKRQKARSAHNYHAFPSADCHLAEELPNTK
jgi:hypothetical protein